MKIRAILAFAAAALFAIPAAAQTSPNWARGYVPSATEWNSLFASKQDALGYTPVNRASVDPTILTALGYPPGSAGALVINGASSGNLGIGMTPVYPLDVAGVIRGTKLILTLATPATSSETCVAGTAEWDADYVYICTATDTWKRAALSTF